MAVGKLRKIRETGNLNLYILSTKDNLDDAAERRFEVAIHCEDATAGLKKPESASSFLRRVLYARWANTTTDKTFDEFYLDEMDIIIQDQISYLPPR